MKYDHEKRPSGRVKEPVQVYLSPSERERLERLAAQLDATKSDVLRRGLEALEQTLTDPDRHPALRIIGIAKTTRRTPGEDIAREHDRVIAEDEMASWGRDPKERG